MIDVRLRVVLLLWLGMVAMRTVWALDPGSRLSQYGHTAWRLSDGFLESAPRVVAQTPDGYLWVGTATGLLRFDGVRFVPWSGTAGTTLPHGGIHALFTARDGSLWIGAGAGLSHLKDGVLFNYASSIALIDGIAQDDAGEIWVGRTNLVKGGGLCKVVGSTLDCVNAEKGFPFSYAGPIVFDHHGNLWAGAANRYIRWSGASQTIYAPKLFEHREGFEGVGAVALTPDGTPLIGLMGSGKELGLEEIVDGSARPYPIKGFDATSIQVQKILFDRHGALWLGTPSGIYRVDHDRVDRFGEDDGLSGGVVSDLTEDREGNIWVVTSQGIDRLRDLPIRSFGKKEGLSGDFAQSLLVAKDGALWIVNGNVIDVLHSGPEVSIQRETRLREGDPIGLVAQDHTGAFWIARGNELVFFDHGVSRTIPPSAGSSKDSPVQALAEDPNGDMWVALNPSREIWRVHNGVASEVTVKTKLPSVYDMVFDHKGELWIGDINGNLAHLHGNTLDRIPFPHRGLPKALLQIGVTEDNAIMGTTAGGVILYKDGAHQILTVENGLPCENLRSFVFDHAGDLWLSSECGTMKVSRGDWEHWRRDEHAIVKPMLFDSLQGARFTEGFLSRAAAITPDGKVWFANGNQLQMVDPASLAGNQIPPPVHIEEVLANGVSVRVGQQIRLPALTHQIEIDYTATSLSLPQKVQFRYILEGHDKHWQPVGTRRQAFFNDLKPGSYRFHVVACNNSGVWNEDGVSIDFEVMPAWFQTKWFMALCGLAVFVTLYGVYRLRIRQLRQRMRVRYDARLEERTRLARDLHDTLLQTIQGSKLVADEALHLQDDLVRLRGAIEKISEWLSRAVVEGRAALTALRSTTNSENLTERLRQAAEECSGGCGMTLRFDVAGRPVSLSAHAIEEIFRIGYEAMRNACAHSKASVLEVHLSYGEEVRLRVKDNGIGITSSSDNEQRSGHYGLPGMRERAERLGGALKIESTPEAGTEVTLVARINADSTDL